MCRKFRTLNLRGPTPTAKLSENKTPAKISGSRVCIFVFNVSYTGISCYSSTNCEEENGAGPFIVSSQEECCVPSQFQARSYRVPLPTTNDGIGLSECYECIGKEAIYNHCIYYQLANIMYINSHERVPCTNRCMKHCQIRMSPYVEFIIKLFLEIYVFALSVDLFACVI